MTSLAIISASDRFDGITQGTEPFIGAFSALGFSVTWYQCVDYRGNPHVPRGGRIVRGFGLPNKTMDMGVNRLWAFPWRLRQIQAETVLLADPTLANVASNHPRVIVRVNDVRPLTRYSDRLSTRIMFRYALPKLKRVWRVFVPSTYVLRQLVDFGFEPEILRVVPDTHLLGLHPEHVEQSSRRIQDQHETRVLFVGADRPYKNIDFFLRLVKRMEGRSGHSYSFTIVSRLRRQTYRRVSELGLSHLRVLANVDSMSRVYADNDVLVFPSLHEGFGRPVAEAMAYGIPVLANRIPPMLEVLGDGGILLDSDNVDSWAQTLAALEDAAAMEVCAKKSLERGRDFLPERFKEALARAIGST